MIVSGYNTWYQCQQKLLKLNSAHTSVEMYNYIWTIKECVPDICK